MLRYWASGMIFSVLSVLSATSAAGAEPSVAVLGVEPVDVPEALAQQLTDALRQRASGTQGIRMIQGKDLIEIKMVFGCDGEAPGCMAQAGKSLGADKLLYGTLKKGPGKNSNNVVIGLKLLDVKSATIEKFISETINKRELAAGSVNASAAKWFGSLVEVESARPTLTVSSDPSGATVAVDGQAVGRTPLTLRDLSAGAHQVVVSASGRATATRLVELRGGGQHEVMVTLEPLPSTPPTVANRDTRPAPLEPSAVTPGVAGARTEPVGHPGRAAKILALASVVGAVVAGSVAIYTWRTYTNLEDTAHAELVGVKNNLANPMPDQAKFFSNPNCGPPSSFGTSTDQYKRDCKSGETYAAATTALWVVAGALGAAGVVSYVVGDRQAARAKERPTTARTIQRSLRLAPVFSTQGGALQAAFEF